MCISSNSVNQAQDLMSVTKFEDFPNSLIPNGGHARQIRVIYSEINYTVRSNITVTADQTHYNHHHQIQSTTLPQDCITVTPKQQRESHLTLTLDIWYLCCHNSNYRTCVSIQHEAEATSA